MVPKAGKAFSGRGDVYDIKSLFNTREDALRESEKIFTAWELHPYNDGEVTQIHFTWYRGQLRQVNSYRSFVTHRSDDIFVTERQAVTAALALAKKRHKERLDEVTHAEKRVQKLEARLKRLPADQPKQLTLSGFIESKKRKPKKEPTEVSDEVQSGD